MTMLRAFITTVAALTLASCGNGSGGTSAQDDGPATLDEIAIGDVIMGDQDAPCLLYTSPSPRDDATSRMPSSA